MKIAITGATSMIGIALIKKCIEMNSEVLAIVRRKSKRINNIPKSNKVQIIECNLDELNTIDVDKKYDVFFHLGWDGTNKKDRNNMDIQVKNIQYSMEAVKLAKKIGCKTFVGAGSQAEYGIKNKKLYTTMREDPNIAYGIAKLSACKSTNMIAKELKIKHIWVRILSVYGPNDNSETLINTLINNIKNGNNIPLTKCEQVWDYLYCDDAAEALYVLGKKGKSNKIYNLSSGKTKKLYYYVETIKKIMDGKAKIEYGKIKYTKDQLMYLSADISEIKALGWEPKINFFEGIKRTIASK